MNYTHVVCRLRDRERIIKKQTRQLEAKEACIKAQAAIIVKQEKRIAIRDNTCKNLRAALHTFVDNVRVLSEAGDQYRINIQYRCKEYVALNQRLGGVQTEHDALQFRFEAMRNNHDSAKRTICEQSKIVLNLKVQLADQSKIVLNLMAKLAGVSAAIEGR